jgi:hypothetical protein
LRHASSYFRLPKGFYGLKTIFLLLAFMALARLAACEPQVLIERLTGLVGELELNWSAGFLLLNGLAIHRSATRRHIVVGFRLATFSSVHPHDC